MKTGKLLYLGMNRLLYSYGMGGHEKVDEVKGSSTFHEIMR
jgi:hypothetical protein